MGALSWVMHVWEGISRKSSRRFTLLTWSMIGQSHTRPGPRVPA